MHYFREYVVKYQEVDQNRQLRLVALENYLLEVAGSVADEVGFGIQYLHPEGLTWILSRLSVQMDYLPTYNEKLVFETWIESNAHLLSTRNFRIWIEREGERQLIGVCKSIWAVLDMAKREVVNIFDRPIMTENIDGEVLEMSRAARMRSLEQPTGSMPHTVVYSDMDYNNHCNSCKYLQALLDVVRPETQGKSVRLDINYLKEVMLGEHTEIQYLQMEDGIQYMMLNEHGETSCSAKVSVL